MDTDKWQRSDNINITSNPVEAALADIVTVPVPPPSLQTYDTVQVRFAQATVPDQVVPTNQDVARALPANLVVETYPVCILKKIPFCSSDYQWQVSWVWLKEYV